MPKGRGRASGPGPSASRTFGARPSRFGAAMLPDTPVTSACRDGNTPRSLGKGRSGLAVQVVAVLLALVLLGRDVDGPGDREFVLPDLDASDPGEAVTCEDGILALAALFLSGSPPLWVRGAGADH